MNTTISSYLSSKGIQFSESGKELITHCLFSNCDHDSKGSEAHLYINGESGLYQCKKCLAKGNWYSLLKHFGDTIKDYPLDGYSNTQSKSTKKSDPKNNNAMKIDEKDIQKYQKQMTDDIRKYLYARGITNETITRKELGCGNVYGKLWITIPIRDKQNRLVTVKLRRNPSNSNGNKYGFISGSTASIYGIEHLQNNDGYVIICEGEFDQMMLEQNALHGITGTGGAGTFKEEWIPELSSLEKIYICYDNDEAGKIGMENLGKRLSLRYPDKKIFYIHLPAEKGKDLSEYFLNGGTKEDLFEKYSEPIVGINNENFKELSPIDLIGVLSLTIMYDDMNKLTVFLAMLSAFTEDAQLNILLNAPSSTGKSYIPLEIAKLFPKESIMELQYVSQSAFFHMGEYDEETNELHVDLERKVIIFIDQPRSELLSRLRPLLSHDRKILESHIVDKSGKGGNKTKVSIIHGYPSVIFCTASSYLDEQEATRMILLSPEIHEEKFRATISNKIKASGSESGYAHEIEDNPNRLYLIDRIQSIKDAHITEILVPNLETVEKLFLERKSILQPRHQRDIGKFLSFIKIFALLNFQNRKRKGSVLFAQEIDVQYANELWKQLEPYQDFNISPYLLTIYRDVFLPAYREHATGNQAGAFLGLQRKYVLQKHFEIYNRQLTDAKWRQDIEPSLINSGLLYSSQEGKTIYLMPTKNPLSEN